MDTHIVPGEVLLGKYRIERVLGRGGMGVVVAARHLELGQLHAIKFLLPDMLGHRETVERFLREARAAAKLQSEHVVRVSDVGRMENGAPFMVMEYLEGCDLKALVAREGPLPIEDALTYVLHVCDAISEAHAAGIIHRDLKPANLFLVRRRGGAPCVKVLDFGISKHLGSDEVDLTSTKSSLGSPLYMSPEQMLRAKAVDTRTDIWALGVILYELLTGSSPFRAPTLLEVAGKVLKEEPRPLRELRPDVPEGFAEIVARCLRKEREERFPNVEALVLALQGIAPRDLTARAPTASSTNETSSIPPQSSGDVHHADTQAIRLDKNAAVIEAPAGDPTTLTFGKTGPAKAERKRHPLVAAGFGAAGIVLAVGVWLGGRSTTRDEPTPAASSIVTAEISGPQVANSIAETPPSTTPEPENPDPMPVAPVPEAAPVSTPDVPVAEVAPEKPLVVPERPKAAPAKVVKAPASAASQWPNPYTAPPANTVPEDPFSWPRNAP